MKPPAPTCIAIVLCQNAYRVQDTTHLILVNTFHSIPVKVCPCKFDGITVVCTLTAGHGTYDVSISIVLAQTGETVYKASRKELLNDPLALLDLHLQLRGVPFPVAGKYWVELHANGELIGQRPFYVDIHKKTAIPQLD